MATYYNKNLIDGISELPRMTQAEFDELSLDEKPINWICRNYTGTQRGIKSSDIEHGTGTVADAIDTKATQNKYTNLNITNSVGGTESNKAVLRASGDIGLCDFTYKCQNASNETLNVSLPTGWHFEYTGVTIRDVQNGNLATCWANNEQMSTYLHTGTMVVGHDYKVCIPCYK